MDTTEKILIGLLVLAGLAGGGWYLVHTKNKAGTHKYNIGDQLEAWGTTLYTVQDVFTAVGPPTQPNFTAGALYYLMSDPTGNESNFLCSTVDNSSYFVKV